MYDKTLCQIFVSTLSSSFLAACICKMRWVLGLGGLLCRVVFGSPKALVLLKIFPSPTSFSLSSVVSW